MRFQSIIFLLSALLLSTAANGQKVSITESIIEKVGDSVTISFDARLLDKTPTNSMLTITPVLGNGVNKRTLPEMVVMGRNKAISEARKAGVRVGGLASGSESTNPYKVTILFEQWMYDGVSLSMAKVLDRCGKRTKLNTIVVAENVLKPTPKPIKLPQMMFETDVKASINNDPFVYSNDEFVKIDKASMLINKANYRAALDILLGLAPTSYTDNLTGVCFTMLKDFVNARLYFQRAIEDGDKGAIKNLELL